MILRTYKIILSSPIHLAYFDSEEVAQKAGLTFEKANFKKFGVVVIQHKKKMMSVLLEKTRRGLYAHPYRRRGCRGAKPVALDHRTDSESSDAWSSRSREITVERLIDHAASSLSETSRQEYPA
jgi:hypothetical protein